MKNQPWTISIDVLQTFSSGSIYENWWRNSQSIQNLQNKYVSEKLLYLYLQKFKSKKKYIKQDLQIYRI